MEVATWVKRDPTNLGQNVPDIVRRQYPRFKSVFSRYGEYIYAAAVVPHEPTRATKMVSAFVDFYGWERGWLALKESAEDVQNLKQALRRHVFPRISRKAVADLLRERRFVILQGPPGTGKSRLADEIRTMDFAGRGQVVQFHPAVTYESFVAGISPDVAGDSLRFKIRTGWLAHAVQQARAQEWILVIDEINRADLGRVLGEAIYLFEVREIAEGRPRSVALPQPLEDGTGHLTIPQGLFVLGTDEQRRSFDGDSRSGGAQEICLCRHLARFRGRPGTTDRPCFRGISKNSRTSFLSMRQTTHSS